MSPPITKASPATLGQEHTWASIVAKSLISNSSQTPAHDAVTAPARNRYQGDTHQGRLGDTRVHHPLLSSHILYAVVKATQSIAGSEMNTPAVDQSFRASDVAVQTEPRVHVSVPFSQQQVS